MSQIDVNEQWRALQENYASMTDEELEAIAQDAGDLTDIARKVLQAEISRRNLDLELQAVSAVDDAEKEVPPAGYPEGFNPEDWGLVDFVFVDDLEQARKVKAIFDDAGIPLYFGPKMVDDIRLLPARFEGPLQTKVRDVDIDRARMAWRQCDLSQGEDEGAVDLAEYSARCPQCHSEDIIFRKLEKSKLQSGEEPKFSWKCEACGHRWKDDGIEQQP